MEKCWIGAAAWGFRDLSLEDQLQTAKELGFQSLELGLSNAPRDISEDAGEDEIRSVKEAYTRFGMKLFAGATGDELSSGNKEELEAQKIKLKKVIYQCSLIGIPYLRIFTGFTKNVDMNEEKWEFMTSAVNELAEFAKKNNVKLAIETHGAVEMDRDGICHIDTVTTDPDSLRRILSEIDESVLFVLDPANLAAVGQQNIERYFELLKERIAYVHMKNFRKTEQGALMPSAVDDGILDWKPLLPLLKKLDKPCLIEYEIPESLRKGCKDSINALQRWGIEV